MIISKIHPLKFGILFLVLSTYSSYGQYAPAAGKAGSTAISKDSSIFVNWANGCSILRGWKTIAHKDSGFTSIGDSLSALGKAGENGVVSLGDSGVAILRFPNPIKDGEGWDFAVFENSFDDRYLELAFVEVSSDGRRYFRFPCHSLSDTIKQTAFGGYTEPENINNLAGKYRFGFGTPFDIGTLPDYKDLNKNSILYVKIVDVIGSLQSKFASFDTANRKINDPWPTTFSSGGFDLDAVGVIHEVASNSLVDQKNTTVIEGPNPINDDQQITIKNANKKPMNVKVYNQQGRLETEFTSSETRIDISAVQLPKGFYYISIRCNGQNTYFKGLHL